MQIPNFYFFNIKRFIFNGYIPDKDLLRKEDVRKNLYYALIYEPYHHIITFASSDVLRDLLGPDILKHTFISSQRGILQIKKKLSIFYACQNQLNLEQNTMYTVIIIKQEMEVFFVLFIL